MRGLPLVALPLVLGASCERRTATSRAPRDPVSAGRRVEHRPLDTLWTRVVEDSATMPMPEWIATDGSNLYLSDHSAGAVVALDVRDGRERWTLRADSVRGGRDGEAPLAGTLALAPRRAGGVIVVDPRRRELVALGVDGHVVRRTPLPPMEGARSVCELPDSTLLVADGGTAGAVLRFEPSGRPAGVVPLPWDDLRAKSTIVTATLLAPTGAGCVGALVFGRGFALFDGDSFGAPRPYVEAMPLIGVVTTRREVPDGYVLSSALAEHILGAIDVAATSRDVLVAFDGRTPDRAHLIDVYDASGRYVRTHRTSRRVEALAASDSALFVLTRLHGLATVVALRRPVAPDAAAR